MDGTELSRHHASSEREKLFSMKQNRMQHSVNIVFGDSPSPAGVFPQTTSRLSARVPESESISAGSTCEVSFDVTTEFLCRRKFCGGAVVMVERTMEGRKPPGDILVLNEN